MKEDWTQINKFRVREGEFASDDTQRAGMFVAHVGAQKPQLIMVADDGCDPDAGEWGGWEHVSVHIRYYTKGKKKVKVKKRLPTWDEMCRVKNMFWENEETVVQYHPPDNEYINNMPYCLHLWKPFEDIVRPPKELVGLINQQFDDKY